MNQANGTEHGTLWAISDPHVGHENNRRIAERLRPPAPEGAYPPDVPLLLVNHYPLVRHPTDILRFPEAAQWCGTEATAGWHRRHRVEGVVHGHLRLLRTTAHNGVPFQEVSLGYQREWRRHGMPDGVLRRVRSARAAREVS
ncbi:hypothetical protein [Streptomyces sp. NBC_00328]|uniref:hypothetical protein n=1 Tax=Streptomyces sp. NBC_00328 TaxID=2903646 RepID=UPI003FA78BE8